MTYFFFLSFFFLLSGPSPFLPCIFFSFFSLAVPVLSCCFAILLFCLLLFFLSSSQAQGEGWQHGAAAAHLDGGWKLTVSSGTAKLLWIWIDAAWIGGGADLQRRGL
jgi:hypothetical protein